MYFPIKYNFKNKIRCFVFSEILISAFINCFSKKILFDNKMLTFSGLNLQKQCVDKFSVKYEDKSLNKVQTTFDSVINTDKTVSYFNYDMIRFEGNFELNGGIISTNTDYIWFLNKSCTQLIKIANELKIVEIVNIDLTGIYNRTVDGSIFICATDINVYLFCENTFKCVYQLENKLKNDDEMKIDECSAMNIPLNKRFGGDNFRIKKISCGKEHVLILTEPLGLVYSFGIGTRGQLGHGTIESSYEPVLIENFSYVKDIECGGWHSSLIDENNNAYMWGWNLNGQLGLYEDDDDEKIVSVPNLLEISLKDQVVKVSKISNGSRHSLFLDFENNMYSCGYNKYRQLIINESCDRFKPCLVEEFKNCVLDIKAGPWYSLILTE